MFKTRFISMLVLLMTAVTGAWADTTVTWTASDMSGIYIDFWDGEAYNNTIKGITVTSSGGGGGGASWERTDINLNSGSTTITFNSSVGNIKSIAITAADIDMDPPSGWTIGYSTLSWSGVASSTVSLTLSGRTDISEISEIVFTIESSTVNVTGITLDKTEASMIVGGETLTLTPTVAPGNATDKTVTWSSSNEAVATVSNEGVVTAVGAGEATITVTTTDGSKTATCAVTVAAPAASTYTVTLKEGTEDATSWQGKAGEGEYQALPLEGVAAGTAVSVKYFGTKKVESVKAKKKAAAPMPTLTLGEMTQGGDPLNNGSGSETYFSPTFSEGQQVAVFYKNTSGQTVKVLSDALTAADISNEGKSATINVTIDDADKTQNVTYIYPAAMANSDGSINYAALNTQDGTLTSLAANLDYCTKSGAWDGDNLPSLTLENQLAILAITLKDSDGSSDITSSITGLTLNDGTNTYYVTREAVAGPIYVAIRPTTSATITVTTTVGTKNYKKTLTGKTYAKGNGYPVSWTMAKVVNYSAAINVPAGHHWYISGSGEHNITIGEDATVTIGSYLRMQYASIICSGNATIILADGTDANIFNGHIKAGPYGTTLTIKGNTGELEIKDGTSYGAAIGASDGDACGNIVIEGGIITATGAMAAGIGAYNAECGNITISGGTVTATGSNGAGIGASSNAKCGDITISGGTVTATGSNGAGIGASYAECGNITISGGTVTATGSNGAGIGSGSSDNGWCGNITISGGTVTATGGMMAAGIGTGEDNGCGDITIKSTVTQVTATKGSGASASIGSATGDDEYCGTVTIEDPSKVTEN